MSEVSLQLRESNPYSTASVEVYSDGTMQLERPFIAYEKTDGDKYHQVKQGDDLRQIAWRYYRNYVEMAHEYWDVIADANEIETPLDISDLAGTTIVIPDILRFKLVYNR